MPRIPTYRLHKRSGRAVVQYRPFYGKSPHYLKGKFNSPESLAEYEDIRARIVASMGVTPSMHRRHGNPTVRELFLQFLDWAEVRYVRKEYEHYRQVARIVKALDEKTRCIEYGPLRLAAARDEMRRRKWSRPYINRQVNRIRRVFRWGGSREMYDGAAVVGNLALLEPLLIDETDAPEPEPVEPVAREDVDRVLPFLMPVVRAMVEVQWLTGMRSKELVELRPEWITEGNGVWIYKPPKHKTSWRKKRKIIVIGPEAIKNLATYRPPSPDATFFSPAIAFREQSAMRRASRKTKCYGKPKAPRQRATAPEYDSHSYQGAINHGFRKLARSILLPQRPDDVSKREWSKRCKPAKGEPLASWLKSVGVIHWHPHQMRHSRATTTRARYGIEGSQAQLGNTLDATELYAEKSLELAVRIALETG